MYAAGTGAATIERAYAKRPRVRVFCQVWDRPSWLDDRKAYPALAAVRHGNLYAIRRKLLQRHTPRL